MNADSNASFSWPLNLFGTPLGRPGPGPGRLPYLPSPGLLAVFLLEPSRRQLFPLGIGAPFRPPCVRAADQWRASARQALQLSSGEANPNRRDSPERKVRLVRDSQRSQYSARGVKRDLAGERTRLRDHLLLAWYTQGLDKLCSTRFAPSLGGGFVFRAALTESLGTRGPI